VAPRALRTEKRVVQRTTRRTPRQATATWSGHPGGDYTVRPGDTLSEIAARFGVEGGWRNLHLRNRHVGGANPDLILPGQRLDVRLSSESRSPTNPVRRISAGWRQFSTRVTPRHRHARRKPARDQPVTGTGSRWVHSESYDVDRSLSWNALRTAFDTRPRSLTVKPFARAQLRTAARSVTDDRREAPCPATGF